jgi:hypothetical protein
VDGLSLLEAHRRRKKPDAGGASGGRVVSKRGPS